MNDAPLPRRYYASIAANCRWLNGSTAAKANLDFLSSDYNGYYTRAIREAHNLLNSSWIVFSADFLIGHSTLFEILLGLDTGGTIRRSIDNYFLWDLNAALFLIKFIELFDDELDKFITLLFRYVQFLKLAVFFRLGEIKPDQVAAYNRTEFLGEGSH